MDIAYVIAVCAATSQFPGDCQVHTIYERREDCFASKRLLDVAKAIGAFQDGRIECQTRQFVKSQTRPKRR